MRDILGCQLISLHTDLGARTGERMVVLTLDANLDERLRLRSGRLTIA